MNENKPPTSLFGTREPSGDYSTILTRVKGPYSKERICICLERALHLSTYPTSSGKLESLHGFKAPFRNGTRWANLARMSKELTSSLDVRTCCFQVLR